MVVNTEKILIVGDFNIHMDNKNDSLRSAFLSITDSIGFSQLVDLPTHCCNHTLDLLPGLYCRDNEDSIIIRTNPNLAEMNQLADSIQFTLRKTLDAVAPLKRKKIPQKKLAPWYNDHTRALKQALRKLERKWFN